MAGIYTGKTTGGVVGGRVILAGGKSNKLKRRGPAGDVVAQPAAVFSLNRRSQTTVEKEFCFLMGKRQLLAADFQQLIAHAQVGNTELRQVAREHHQGHILRLMAEEEAHRIVNHRIVDQMIIINHQIQRALPVGKLNKQLRKKRGQAGILAFLHHVFAGHAVAAGSLLNRGDQITGKTLLLVIAFIQRKPAKFIFPRRPLRDERCLAVPSGAGDQHETVIVRAGKFSQQSLANHGVFKADWAT